MRAAAGRGRIPGKDILDEGGVHGQSAGLDAGDLREPQHGDACCRPLLTPRHRVRHKYHRRVGVENAPHSGQQHLSVAAVGTAEQKEFAEPASHMTPAERPHPVGDKLFEVPCQFQRLRQGPRQCLAVHQPLAHIVEIDAEQPVLRAQDVRPRAPEVILMRVENRCRVRMGARAAHHTRRRFGLPQQTQSDEPVAQARRPALQFVGGEHGLSVVRPAPQRLEFRIHWSRCPTA